MDRIYVKRVTQDKAITKIANIREMNRQREKINSHKDSLRRKK